MSSVTNILSTDRAGDPVGQREISVYSLPVQSVTYKEQDNLSRSEARKVFFTYARRILDGLI